MIVRATQAQRGLYDAGYNARNNGEPKSPPGQLNWAERHWWLGGWNDRDIEIDGPETPAKVVRRGKP